MNKNVKIVLFLLVIFFIILGIILGIIFCICKLPNVKDYYEYTDIRTKTFETQVKYLNEIFNNTNSDANNPSELGGLICNNYGTRWFKMALDDGDISMKNTSVCAHVNRNTCSAYSLIRKDLIPMIFKMIGIQDSAPCGIILDVSKCWPLITLMTIVDGDTNNRTCCSNETGGAFINEPTIESFAIKPGRKILMDSIGPGYKSDLGGKCIRDSFKKAIETGNIINNSKVDLRHLNFDNLVMIWPAFGPSAIGNTGGNCSLNCADDNLKCKYNSTGGNWNWWAMADLDNCADINGIGDCMSFKIITNIDDIQQKSWNGRTAPDPSISKPWVVVAIGQGINIDKTDFDSSNGCKFCEATNLCTLKYLPSKYKIKNNKSEFIDFTNKKYTNYDQSGLYGTIFDKKKNEIYNFIGPDGKGWDALYGISNGYNGFGGEWLGYASVTQCRWEKKYWEEWINALRRYYKSILDIYNKDSKPKDIRNDFATGKNYMENEVNIHVNTSNNYNNEYYKRDNKIWQSAIVGFYYEVDTCEDIMAPLTIAENKPITQWCNDKMSRTFWVDNIYCKNSNGQFYTPEEDGEFVDTREDSKRWSEDQGNCNTNLTNEQKTQKRREWENRVRIRSKNLTHQVATMFNKKHNLNVPVFISHASSQIFPRYNDFKQALDKNVTFDQMFTLDPTYSNN